MLDFSLQVALGVGATHYFNFSTTCRIKLELPLLAN